MLVSRIISYNDMDEDSHMLRSLSGLDKDVLSLADWECMLQVFSFLLLCLNSDPKLLSEKIIIVIW